MFTQSLRPHRGSLLPQPYSAMNGGTLEGDSTPKSAKQRSKPPFKMCFRQRVDPGRSNVAPFRPRAFVHYVTRKFHCPDYSSKCSEEIYQKVKNEFENEPKKKYGYPVLESHSYGWYSDVKFYDPYAFKDRRLHFHKTVNPLFSQPF